MVCKLASSCPFFNDKTEIKAETAAHFKAKYCRGRFAECARYTVYAKQGREAVPFDLGPHDHLRARQILRTKKPD